MTRSATTAFPGLPTVMDVAIAVGGPGRSSVLVDGPRQLGRRLEVGDCGAARKVGR